MDLREEFALPLAFNVIYDMLGPSLPFFFFPSYPATLLCVCAHMFWSATP